MSIDREQVSLNRFLTCPNPESRNGPETINWFGLEKWDGQVRNLSYDVMRLGIFGGTFDPVHNGHLLLAEQCREQCRLDEVWFVPAGVPPHKLARTLASGKARAEMLELAVAGHDFLRVDRRELDRNDPCYTVETLAGFKSEDPARELVFLMGADSLAEFPTWREPRRIVELAELAVVNRGGTAVPDSKLLHDLLGETLVARIHHVTISGMDVSSSEIRRRIGNGKSIRFMVPRAVECYIETHELYR